MRNLAKSKQAKAREFSAKARKRIRERDNNTCIFCVRNYNMERATPAGLYMKSIMHYIPRAQNGLGIEENGALGCQYHHEMMDNGNMNRRGEMLGIFRDYLRQQYPDWNEKKLVYSKWNY